MIKNAKSRNTKSKSTRRRATVGKRRAADVATDESKSKLVQLFLPLERPNGERPKLALAPPSQGNDEGGAR
jgi:hypothetical protein